MQATFTRRLASQKSAVFHCNCCKRRTRYVNQAMPGLCPQCDEWTQIENSIGDGAYRDDPAGLRKAEEHIARLKAEAVAKGGKFDAPAVVDPEVSAWARSILANDEASTDAELVEHFVTEGGMDRAAAEAIVARRMEFLKADPAPPPSVG